MIDTTPIFIPEVTHIGFFSGTSDRRKSLDGPCISVTTQPELWRGIKGLNGPQMTLRFSAAQWFDGFSVMPSDLEIMRKRALSQNYMKEVTAWQGLLIDEETGDVSEPVFLSREEGARAFGRSLEEEVDAFSRGEGALEEIRTMMLTRRGERKLERWPSPLASWEQAAIMLYVKDVVLPKRPYLVGIWWSEPENMEMGSAPSGSLFPERLHHFEVETEDGDFGSVSELFPDVRLPVDPVIFPE